MSDLLRWVAICPVHLVAIGLLPNGLIKYQTSYKQVSNWPAGSLSNSENMEILQCSTLRIYPLLLVQIRYTLSLVLLVLLFSP